MTDHAIFSPSPGRCWECGSPSLRAVSDGDDINFVCPSCGACCHIALGQVHRVHPATCPGCEAPPALLADARGGDRPVVVRG